MLKKGVERAQSIKEGKRGEVKIGTLPTYTTGLFTSAVSEMHENYPEIDLVIHSGHNQQIIEMLYDGIIKMGLITYPFFNSDLKKLLLMKEPLILVAHKCHRLSKLKARTYTIEEVFANSSPYILTDWSDESKHWQRTHITFGMDTLELPPPTALDFVRLGKGVALLTKSLAQDLLNIGTLTRLFPMDFPELYRWVALVSMESESSLTPAARSFLETLKINIETDKSSYR